MANLTTSGTTSYPTGVDTRTTVTDDPGGTEVVAAHHNGVAAAVIAVETALGTTPYGSAADVATRLNVSQNADGTLKSSVLQAGTGTSINYASGVFTVAYNADSPQVNQNLGFDATVAGNALTVSIMDKNAATPSSTSTVLIPFRSSTETSGTYVVRSIATTTSVTLPAGGTLGFTNNEVGRIYLYGCDNAGTVEAGVARRGNHSEGALHTTVAITAGSSGMDTIYTAAARTNVAIRLLGYLEIQTGGTAGNWSNSPTRKQIYGPGVRRTGDIVRMWVTTSSALATGTRLIPADDTVPQSNEGDAYFVQEVNFTSAINHAIYDASFMINNGATGYMTAALFRPQIANAFMATGWHMTATESRGVSFIYQTLTGVLASTTICLRIGSAAVGTTAFNNNDGTVSTRSYGGTAGSTMRVIEVMA